MARVPGNPTSASLGHETMTRTIYCPQCGVVLNVPDSAAGRKLRCPKCATKFAAPAANASAGDSVVADPSPASSIVPTKNKSKKRPESSGNFGLPTRRDSSGSIELPTSRPISGDFDLPMSPAPLREQFDLPLLGEDLPKAKSSPGQAKTPAAADAMALFQDEPKSKRKVTGAEARSKPRRCPSCGGVVGIGMSLCNTCGLDLDTGQRIAPLDVFDDELPEAPRSESPTLGVMFVGGLSFMANLLLSVATVVASVQGGGSGMLFLLVVWLFGIYASVQFLRRKSIRPLFLAHGLGVGIGAVFLIVLPIWNVTFGTDVVDNGTVITAPPVNPDDPTGPVVPNLAKQLEENNGMARITWGIALLLSYAALSVYMNTPSMKREFTKR
jgi:hypothetical protein